MHTFACEPSMHIQALFGYQRVLASWTVVNDTTVVCIDVILQAVLNPELDVALIASELLTVSSLSMFVEPWDRASLDGSASIYIIR